MAGFKKNDPPPSQWADEEMDEDMKRLYRRFILFCLACAPDFKLTHWEMEEMSRFISNGRDPHNSNVRTRANEVWKKGRIVFAGEYATLLHVNNRRRSVWTLAPKGIDAALLLRKWNPHGWPTEMIVAAFRDRRRHPVVAEKPAKPANIDPVELQQI